MPLEDVCLDGKETKEFFRNTQNVTGSDIMKTIILFIIFISTALSTPTEDINVDITHDNDVTEPGSIENATTIKIAAIPASRLKSSKVNASENNSELNIETNTATASIHRNVSDVDATAAFVGDKCATGYDRADNGECVPIEG